MDATQEEWRPVVGYECSYEVSSLGRVRSVDRVTKNINGIYRRFPGVMMTPQRNSSHLSIRLSRNGIACSRLIHHLVAEAFIGPRPAGLMVCHNNDHGTDNRSTNLRYDTASENSKDHVRSGRHYEIQRTHCPRGHRLINPNLRLSKRRAGARECLVCHRTRAWVAFKPDVRSEMFKQESDRRYAKLGVPGCVDVKAGQ